MAQLLKDIIVGNEVVGITYDPANSGNGGVSVNSLFKRGDSSVFTIEKITATANTEENVLTLFRNTSGGPASSGFGMTVDYNMVNASDEVVTWMKDRYYSSINVSGFESGRYIKQLKNGPEGMLDVLTIESSGRAYLPNTDMSDITTGPDRSIVTKEWFYDNAFYYSDASITGNRAVNLSTYELKFSDSDGDVLMGNTGGDSLLKVYNTVEGAAVTAEINPSSFNSIIDVLEVKRRTSSASGNPGIGAGISFWLDTDAGNNVKAGSTSISFSNPSIGIESSIFKVELKYSGALVDRFTVKSNGGINLEPVAGNVAIGGQNGDIVYVTSTFASFTSTGFWGFENGAWRKI